MKTIQFSCRRSVHAIFLLLVFLCCFSFTTQATTYYVSATGNDVTGNGTAGNPWKTLFKATSTVTNAGDIIHVNAGTYLETSMLSLAVGVNLEGADSSTTIIKSTVSADYTPLMNVSSAVGTNGNQSISNLKFDGQLTNFLAIFVGGRGGVSIHDCSFKNFKDRGIIFSGKGDYTDGAPAVYASNNKFYNNRVLNCARYIHPNGYFGMGCLNIGGQNGIEIYNNTIIQNQRASGDNGWPIKYANEGHNKGIKIHDNTLIKNKFLGNYNGDNDWDFAVELWYSEGGCELYNNTIEGGVDLAYNFQTTYPWSYWVHHNTISQPTLNDKFQGGIYTEREVQGMIIEYNTFNNVADMVSLNIEDFPPQPSFNGLNYIVIRKNLATNLGRAIGNGNNGSAVNISTHTTATFNLDSLLIDNNTFVAAPGNAPFEGIYLNFGATAGVTTNVFIRNNIVQGFQDAWLRVGNSNSTINGFNVKNNDVYNNANGNNPILSNGTPTGYTYTGNTNNNPMFVGGNNYNLQVSSPNVDAGTNIGLAYSGSAPDKGFAEVGTILPVQLINFGVTENRGNNLLQWTTAVESNSDYFSIERSSDGKNFTSIGTVKAAGFSSTDINYSFTDAAPLTGVNYYRLAQVDKDNSKNFSNTVAISNKSDKSLNIAIAKLSRSNNNMEVTVVSAQNQKTNISLFDANGKLFLNETVQLQKGLNNISKNTRALSSGIYYIRLSAADETVVKNVLSKE